MFFLIQILAVTVSSSFCTVLAKIYSSCFICLFVITVTGAQVVTLSEESVEALASAVDRQRRGIAIFFDFRSTVLMK